MKTRVLVVEDDSGCLEILANGLVAEGFEVIRADELSKSFQEILKLPPNIILADFQLREGTAFDLLAWLKTRDIRIPLIVLTAQTNIDLAVEAVKNGTEHFISKPVDFGHLVTVLRRTLENARNRQKVLAHKMVRARYERNPFLGTSPAILKLREEVERVSKTNSTVLIQGESGTGKGVLAHWLHKIGSRSNEAYVDLNCAGLSGELLESELFGYQKGAFTGAVTNKVGFLEAANHGTVLLDEIGDLDLHVQPKILKVVEEKQFYRLGDVHERKVDVRIIVATHRDLKELVREGKFREDLYFRISAIRLRIPPLRERSEDIPVITDMLLEQFSWDMSSGPLRISDDARLALQHYSWPGNIRELRNVLERAVILRDNSVIKRTGLEFEVPARQDFASSFMDSNLTLEEMEKRYILHTLASEGGHVTQAAIRLGMPRSSLYAKIQQHGLNISSYELPKLVTPREL